jgi:hypothetical protein
MPTGAILERDCRLKLLDDPFTVDLLSRFIKWELDRNREADHDARAAVLASSRLTRR